VARQAGQKDVEKLGNGLDPLELIDEFGADALKFTIAFSSQGPGRASRQEPVKAPVPGFATRSETPRAISWMNLEGRSLLEPDAVKLTDIDRWILSQLNAAAAAARAALEGTVFNEAAQAVYEFIWSDFCDWYIEASKAFPLRGRP